MNATIAVVDDDVRILDAIEMVFKAVGIAVETFTSGEVFLGKLALGCVPGCLLLDPHLPGISGREVARATLERSEPIPIIVLTARPGSPVTRGIMKMGVRTLLTKPVAADELVNHVHAAVGLDDGRQ